MAFWESEATKKLKGFTAERAKIFEFLGMEIYDLYTKEQILIESIEPFCAKIRELNAEIAKLKTNETAHLCECGEKLKKGAVFCQKCGRRAVHEQALPTLVSAPPPEAPKCICGEEIKNNTTLCMGCGRRTEC